MNLSVALYVETEGHPLSKPRDFYRWTDAEQVPRVGDQVFIGEYATGGRILATVKQVQWASTSFNSAMVILEATVGHSTAELVLREDWGQQSHA